MSRSPEVSVIIPAFAATGVIETQFAALANQTFAGSWEVVVADNGQNAGLEGIVERWTSEIPDLRVVSADHRRGAGFARHVAMWQARAEHFALCDADDAVGPTWLAATHSALGDHGIVTGPLVVLPFDRLSPEVDLAELLASEHRTTEPSTYREIPYAPSCNCGFRRNALPQGFPAEHYPGEDGAATFRAMSLGYDIGWAGEAVVAHRMRPKNNPVFRRATAAGVGRRRLDREFAGVLWADASPRLIRRIGWLVSRLPRAFSVADRHELVWESGVVLGTALEHFFPGLWHGRLEAHPPEDDSRIVAQVP
jgi:glycosyltransferase involved in cell wall biosynthesis